MSTVPSDLSALLNRVRKTNGLRQTEPAEVESPAEPLRTPNRPDQELAHAEPAFPPLASSQAVAAAYQEELRALHLELHADELLLERILGMLYRAKKENPNSGYISILDMEKMLGLEREGAAFIMMYMKTKKVIQMDDKSRMAITVEGIDYLRAVMIRDATGG